MKSLFLSRRSLSSGALLLIVLTLPWLSGCNDETLMAPEIKNDLFKSYVALGNSITAGFQADGINQTLQQQSYAVRLASQMSTPFGVPALQPPGCPPPLTQIFPPARTASVDCALRATPTPLRVNNVAVPGAWVQDALTNSLPAGAHPNALTSFILGGRTQVQAAMELNPTFATVWLGNNDVLRAALIGNPALSTSPSTFSSRYTSVLDSLEAAGVQGGAIASVANVTRIPNLSPGQAYAAAETRINQIGQQRAANDDNPNTNWGNYSVASNCASGPSGTQSRISFRYGFEGLFTLALAGQNVELDCTDNRTLAEIYGQSTLDQLGIGDVGPLSVLLASETQQLVGRLKTYNNFLATEADNRGWAFVDVNKTFAALYAAGSNTPDPADDLVPKFPRLGSDTPTFGKFFSEDGVHPSAETHRVVTNLFIEQINAKYGTSLQTIQAPNVPTPSQ
ncbi:MAG: SGNH/GDSL hydrolase family protein [Salinibacter sp.]